MLLGAGQEDKQGGGRRDARKQALNAGLRTPDTALAGEQALVAHEVGDAIARAVESGEIEAQAAVAV